MMTDQDKSDMTLLIRAQLEEQHGKIEGPSWTKMFLAISIMLNVGIGYCWYVAHNLLQQCTGIL
jgi:hypothetical protein